MSDVSFAFAFDFTVAFGPVCHLTRCYLSVCLPNVSAIRVDTKWKRVSLTIQMYFLWHCKIDAMFDKRLSLQLNMRPNAIDRGTHARTNKPRAPFFPFLWLIWPFIRFSWCVLMSSTLRAISESHFAVIDWIVVIYRREIVGSVFILLLVSFFFGLSNDFQVT